MNLELLIFSSIIWTLAGFQLLIDADLQGRSKLHHFRIILEAGPVVWFAYFAVTLYDSTRNNYF